MKINPRIFVTGLVVVIALTVGGLLLWLPEGGATPATSSKPHPSVSATPAVVCPVQVQFQGGNNLCIRFSANQSIFPLSGASVQQVCVASGTGPIKVIEQVQVEGAVATLKTPLLKGCYQPLFPVVAVVNGGNSVEDGVDVGYLGRRELYDVPSTTTGPGTIHAITCGNRDDFFKLYEQGGGNGCFADAGLLHVSPPIPQVDRVCGGNNVGDIPGTHNAEEVDIHLTRFNECVDLQKVLGFTIGVDTIYIRPLV